MSQEIELQQKILTPHQQQALELAHGKMHVLCVGVSEYSHTSGFSKLTVCVNDAAKVANCFQDVHELNAEKKHIRLITSKHGLVSKGAILQAVNELACAAGDSDRILFYFSGHGQRLGDDDFYLVPQDVFQADHKDTLLSFSQVVSLLNESDAKQKIIILDACFSGPSLLYLKFLYIC